MPSLQHNFNSQRLSKHHKVMSEDKEFYLCKNREIGFVFDISEKYRRSSKLEILMAYLAEAVNAGKKCVVLSHFHPMLLLLEYDLAANEVDYLV